MITGKNYIGNVLSSIGKNTFRTFNSQLNKKNNSVYTEASSIEIEKAVELAEEAFEVYKKISGIKKSNFLNKIASELENLGVVLIETYCKESGLLKERAIAERTRTIFQLRSFANLVKNGSWVSASINVENNNIKPITKPTIRKMLVPIGPIVVFGASNFPLAYSTAGGDTASALAAGCPVIVKSHPMHAETSELVASAIIKAAESTGMPNGVFSNLNSSGIKVGKQLVQHPAVKAVGFTGSIAGGRALFNLASKRKEPIPVFAEMGSINPVIILPNAIKNNAIFWAKQYASSIALGSGQFCTNPGLILGIKSKKLTGFMKQLGNQIIQIEPSCILHPTIIEAYEKNSKNIQNQKGITTVAVQPKKVLTNYGKQKIVTVKGKTFLKNKKLHNEVFGPFSLIVQCKNKEQLTTIIKNLEGQLTGTILAEETDAEDFKETIDVLKNKVGRIIFNGVSTGVEVCNSIVHGGPYPASTDSRFTAVGVNSIKRWVRPFSFQNWPNTLLPNELQNENPLQIIREINGKKTKSSI